MADVSSEQLKKEIHAVLREADLSVVSAKSIREQIEKKLNCSLIDRKKEFDKIVMDFINQVADDENGEGDDSEDDGSSDEDSKKAQKRQKPASRKAAPPKKKKKSTKESGSDESSDGNDSDYRAPKKPVSKKKSASKTEKGTTGRKSTGFTRAYQLSPELSALMGEESLPRHEVVKKVWAIIKERNLYDPKNKQYAICDDELLKVMRVKRFRTFAMLKHLKPHFLN